VGTDSPREPVEDPTPGIEVGVPYKVWKVDNNQTSKRGDVPRTSGEETEEVDPMFTIAQTQAVQISQSTVIAILAASTIVVVALIALIAYFASRTPTNLEGGPLHFGNFFVVSLGILAALIGFLIAFPLVISGVFADPTQVIALLSGLFGTIVGLVGTYFGIKSSGDASQKAQELARAMAVATPDTTPDGTTTVDKKSLAKAPPQGKAKNGKP
jgi:hypothetical protein